MSDPKRRSPCEIASEIVAAFLHGPRTRRSLYDFVGVRREKDYLEKYIRQFRASGVLYVEQYDAKGSEVLALQPTPFANKDADPPPKELGRRNRAEGKLREPQVFAYEGRMLKISELAALAGVGHPCMWQRLRRGMSPKDAVALGKSRAPWPRKKRGPSPQAERAAPTHFAGMSDYLAARGIG